MRRISSKLPNYLEIDALIDGRSIKSVPNKSNIRKTKAAEENNIIFENELMSCFY